MKKPKFSFGEGGVKGWLAQHVEKIVLGVVAVLVLVFLYNGISIEPFKGGTPDGLKSQAGSASEHISRDTWTEIVEPKRNPGFDHPTRAEKSLTDTSPEYYSLSMPLDKLLTRLKKKRTDPDLYPPEQVEVSVAYGPLAVVRPEGFIDPFWDVEQAPPTTTTTGRPRPRQPEEDPGELLGPAIIPGLEGRGTSGKMVPPRMLEQPLGYSAGTESAVKGVYVAAVKALIPYRKQTEEFKYRFVDSKEYLIDRDSPRYVWVKVQRVEVADPASEPDWTKAVEFSSADARRAMTNWAGMAEPVVDDRFYDEALTFAIPPMPIPRDQLNRLALHSQTPSRILEALQEQAEPESTEPPEGTPELPGFEGPGGLSPSGPSRGEGGRFQEGGRFSGGGNSPYNEGGTGMILEEAPRYKLVRFFDFGVQPGKHYRDRMQVWLQDPNRPQVAPAGNAAQGGETGRGGGTLADPKPETLDPTVLARLKQVADADAKANRRTWWRTTDWSEVSAAVSVPKPRQVLAGKAIPQGVSTIRELGIVYKRGEPSGTVAAAIWDEKKAATVAGEMEVSRSSVVDFKADSQVLNPLSRELKPIYGYEFQTGSIILDIEGGQALGKNKEQTTPGEYLVLDEAGNLVVRNQFEDHQTYRDSLFLMEQTEQPAGEGFFPGVEPGREGAPGRFDEFFPGGEEGGRPPRRRPGGGGS